MRQREIGIERDGLLEHLYGELQAELAGIAATAEVEIISLQILGGLARDNLLFLRRKRNAQRLRDAPGNFLLNREHVFQLPVIALGPDRMPRRGFDKLYRDPHARAGAADGPLQHVGGAELLAYLLRGDWLVAECEHLRARKNIQLRDF